MSDETDSTVFVADEQHDVDVDLLRWSRLARLVLDSERVAPDVHVALVFVDEPAMAQLNERFLGEQGATDVLAFPIDDDVPETGRVPDRGGKGPGSATEPTEPPVLLGDVYVCPSVAQRNADQRSIAIDAELALLVVHGLLHLLDYDHTEPEETEAMQAREREILAAFAEDEARS
jgi:probable rRNA maturation factor